MLWPFGHADQYSEAPSWTQELHAPSLNCGVYLQLAAQVNAAVRRHTEAATHGSCKLLPSTASRAAGLEHWQAVSEPKMCACQHLKECHQRLRVSGTSAQFHMGEAG